ncbi:sensor histidine kinase [Wenjunlia tyrosinilytica]|uniref:histidine kinase n=1 Tax=Wenjunlia tyrosinilytica TaxID=1544741 RepID=A0A917ZMD2_9ACTN|nr:nitrate- and nitrite sensing domain-containing protein [Wenjunlia tyrosinilytica]GGO85470.1 histidine kinase [Wenjunlia tyrosinilytica]
MGAAPPRKRVRSRFLALIAVCVVAVVAVGAPGVVGAAGDLSESQRLDDLGELNRRAVALSHSLADERDQMAVFIAAGRSTSGGAGLTESQRTRVDRQAAEVRRSAADVDPGDDPAVADRTEAVGKLLATLPDLRQRSLSGPGSAKAAFDSYTRIIDALGGLGRAVVEALPGRAADADTTALPALGRAVEQASAQRGLLLSALAAGGSQPPYVRAAQQAGVREEAALADYNATASTAAQDRYSETVTGKEVDDAEAMLRRLTDQPRLSGNDFRLRIDDVESALTARIDRMRSVESSLTGDAAYRLESMRNEDVVDLELTLALLALGALVVLGFTVQVSRSVVRPLAALRKAADDLNGRVLPPLNRRDVRTPEPRPVSVTARDEFRSVAEAVSGLQEAAVRLHGERGALASEHGGLLGVRDALAAERDALLLKQESLLAERDSLQVNLHNTFVSLSMRTLSLVERQLALIERLENHEQDAEQLESLFQLDHLATRMRRNGENLLVLAGEEHSAGSQRGPVPLIDVLRAAISEIERYERVRIQFMPATYMTGFAADDTSHLVAELLENATAFSPPQSDVEVSGWVLENGEVMLSVEDRGIGVPADRLAELNEQLNGSNAHEEDATRSMGLFVVARLARRHGIRVQLREMRKGGVTAVVVLPRDVVVAPEQGEAPQVPVPQPRDGDREPKALARCASRRLERIRKDAPAQGTPPPAALGATASPASPASPATHGVPAPRVGGPAEEGEGGEEHSRPDGDTPEEPPTRPKPARKAPPAQEPAADEPPRLTRAGLPKRVPNAGSLHGGPAPVARRKGRTEDGGETGVRGRGVGETAGRAAGVSAEELRRRLGGFQRGLLDGRRDAEAAVADLADTDDGEARG